MPKEHCGRERHGAVGRKTSPIKVTSATAGEASAGNRREAASENSRLQKSILLRAVARMEGTPKYGPDGESLMKLSRVWRPGLVVQGCDDGARAKSRRHLGLSLERISPFVGYIR